MKAELTGQSLAQMSLPDISGPQLPLCSSENCNGFAFSQFAFFHDFNLRDKLLTLSIFKEFKARLRMK